MSKALDGSRSATPDPEPILPAVAREEAEAVRDCMDRYGSLVRALARRSLYRSAEVDDAVQEIFIELWKHAKRFDPDKSSEASFVATIARRRLIDRLRREGARPTTAPLDDAFEVEDPAADRAEIRAEAGRVTRALAGLKAEQRRLIRLSVHLGMSHGEIAAATRLPLGTVKSHIRRGLGTLRERLTGVGPLPINAT